MAERRATAARRRAGQMMRGGAIAGAVVGILVIGLGLVLGGAPAAVTAAIGFVSVFAFYGLGQLLEVKACDLEPMQGMVLVLGSYALRVTGITAALWVVLNLDAIGTSMRDEWLVLSVAGTVLAWTTGVVVIAARQRVPVYDAEYLAPGAQESPPAPGK